MKARVASSLATAWNSIFLFGGQTATGEVMNDLWVLQLDSLTWTQLGDGKAPISGRYGQVMGS